MKLKGQIDYQLHIDEESNWSLNFTSTTENDMAAMAISQYVLEQMMEGLKEDKENSKGRMRKELSSLYGSAADARAGIKCLLEYMQNHYKSYQDKIEADAAEELGKIRLELLKVDEIPSEQLAEMKEAKGYVENHMEEVKKEIIADGKKLRGE